MVVKSVILNQEACWWEKSVKFIDNNNCSKDEIERMEKTEEIFQSYADSVTMVKQNIIKKSGTRSLTILS